MNPAKGKRMGNGARWILPLGLALLVAACGPSKMAKDQLEKARQAYAQAKENPEVARLAPGRLTDAERAVREAAQAGNSDDMIHLSYMAETKSRIAVAVAERKMAEEETQKLNEETARAIEKKKELDRLRELEKKKAEEEAERARQTAAAEAERAVRAKAEAEQARLAAAAEAERAARAQAEAEMLMKELSELKAKQTERGIVLTIGDVLFAFGKADLSSKADRSVEKLAAFLTRYPDRNVLIEGHTDSVGSDAYNLELSRRRSESVMEKLVADGIDSGRITTVGYGKKYPAYSNDTEADRAQNRRVEVIILNEGVKAETQLRE